jgi:uncharacterized protein YkwD
MAAMTRRSQPRFLIAAAVVAFVVSALGTGMNPSTANAATTLSPTPDSVETTFLNWINTVRVGKGLVPLRLHPGLVKLAGDWAAHSASTGVLALPSCTSCMLTDYGVQKYNYGSMESWSTYNWGADAINSIESGWKQHSTEWAKLMSSTFNYVGIGVAYRASNGSMWVTVFETESRDRTSPWAKTGTATHTGGTVSWSWNGGDTKLQSHTSGLQNFDVQYRVDGGTWTTIKSGTTAKSLTLTNRASGHSYGIRVRSRDNRGYVSAWSAEMSVLVR